MKKKFSYVVLFLMMFSIFLIKPNAIVCEYSDGKLSATFEVNKEKGTLYGNAIINGTLNSSDETNIENESQSIENWDKEFKASSPNINMKGQDYYANNNECPPYSIFVDRLGQFDLVVSDESHLEEFKKYGESKQGYAIMNLVNPHEEPSDEEQEKIEDLGSCAGYTSPESCTKNEFYSCVWNEIHFGDVSDGYCNTDNLMYVQCGDAFDIPYQLPSLFSMLVNLLKIATPIVLVIIGVISLLKSLTASKEDEIKKAQQSLIKKMIAAAMVFFIISIVQFVILKVADTDNSKGASEADNVSTCLSCFLNNDCSNNIYYKTNVAGEYICKYINGNKSTFTCKGNK